MKVTCVNNQGTPHLSVFKEYEAFAEEGDFYHLTDDSGLMGLYKKSRFTIESEEPTEDSDEQWVKSKYDKVEKPKHYHMYEMDTLTFLEKGFPSSVLEGFLIGNVIKYTQRYSLKNGQEDLEKANFYSKRLAEFNTNKV